MKCTPFGLDRVTALGITGEMKPKHQHWADYTLHSNEQQAATQTKKILKRGDLIHLMFHCTQE